MPHQGRGAQRRRGGWSKVEYQSNGQAPVRGSINTARPTKLGWEAAQTLHIKHQEFGERNRDALRLPEGGGWLCRKFSLFFTKRTHASDLHTNTTLGSILFSDNSNSWSCENSDSWVVVVAAAGLGSAISWLAWNCISVLFFLGKGGREWVVLVGLFFRSILYELFFVFCSVAASERLSWWLTLLGFLLLLRGKGHTVWPEGTTRKGISNHTGTRCHTETALFK